MNIYSSSTASAATHSAITLAQRSKPSTCRSEYVSIGVCTYNMHVASGLFPGTWSSWHLRVACLHLIFLTIYYICHSVPFLPCMSEGSGRNGPLRDAPCIYTSRYTLPLNYEGGNTTCSQTGAGSCSSPTGAGLGPALDSDFSADSGSPASRIEAAVQTALCRRTAGTASAYPACPCSSPSC